MTDIIPPLVVINPTRAPFKDLPQLEIKWHSPVISLTDLITFENQINSILDWHPLSECRFEDLQHIRNTFFES